MMKSKLLSVGLVLVTLGLLTGATGAPQRVRVGREFEVKAGAEVLVKEAGLSIRFSTVVEDSRCPEGVDCVWAGNGKVALTLSRGRQKPATVELNTMLEPRSVTYGGYEVTLLGLAPYPKKDTELKKEEYVATFKVSRVKTRKQGP